MLKPKNKKEGQEEEEDDDEETEAAEEQENGDDDTDDEDDQEERGKKSKRSPKPKRHVSSSLPASHVKQATKAQKAYARKLTEIEATVMQTWPILVPCAGCCPNYLHLDCATPGDSRCAWEEGQEPSKVFCRLCKEGLRQCCLCLVSIACSMSDLDSIFFGCSGNGNYKFQDTIECDLAISHCHYCSKIVPFKDSAIAPLYRDPIVQNKLGV